MRPLPALPLITIGQHLSPELADIERQLRRSQLTYSFDEPRDLLTAWELAREQRMSRALQPAAVIWLQSRPSVFQQDQLDEVRRANPSATQIVVTGCLCEGELRTGRPLKDITRISWNQGAGAVLAAIPRVSAPRVSVPRAPSGPQLLDSARWLAIHSPQFETYTGLSLLGHSLGYSTLWQPDHLPCLSSEPAVRMFCEWPSWDAWQRQSPVDAKGGQRSHPAADSAVKVLLLSFPRPADLVRASQLGLARVLSLPFSVADLQAAIAAAPQPQANPTGQLGQWRRAG
jgi:hypothetical protein